ncbi:MAG: alpha/beta hydrolase [Alistipes sp.]|nr:alpha/beta hydrolase [Alistipes sp.]
MKRQGVLFLFLCLCATSLWAQMPQPQPLYPQGVPSSNGIDPAQSSDNGEVAAATTTPDYTLFQPSRNLRNGQAVIVCPGGGYGCTCYDREGFEVAQWLNTQGITAVVLRYRMPNGHPEIPMEDVRALFGILCANAEAWGVDPTQIGIMGFSAGGHLAATAATHIASAETRPAFAVLIYPVITFREPYAHLGTRQNLLGATPTAEQIALYSNEEQVSAQTPPCFIALSDNDEVVPVQNSMMMYNALKQYNIPVELHIYPTGHHGWIDRFVYWDEYHRSLARWLMQQRESVKEK